MSGKYNPHTWKVKQKGVLDIVIAYITSLVEFGFIEQPTLLDESNT